jgi:branched-subunit amino acid ABC-type transport system permease component
MTGLIVGLQADLVGPALVLGMAAAGNGFGIERMGRIPGALVVVYSLGWLLGFGAAAIIPFQRRTGVFLGAIADDPDASRWVGIPLGLVGTGVFAFSGALFATGRYRLK